MPAISDPRPGIAVTRSTSVLADRVISRVGGVVVDPADIDLKARLEGIDAVVHLGSPGDVATVTSACSAASVGQIVFASSATVYGAWGDNAVPLTEDVPLRPNPGFAAAEAVAEAERLLAEWRDDHPDARVAVLRLAPVLAPGTETWVSATLARPSMLRPADALPPVQVVHVDDAVAAVAHAVESRLDGTFNVAPDDYTSGDTARELAGGGIPLPSPEWLARRIERLFGLVPPGATPYREHPWVIANDRLRATGWSPQYTTEEALVACRKGSWWRELSPDRRQQVTLGAAGAMLAAAAVGSVKVFGSFRAKNLHRTKGEGRG